MRLAAMIVLAALVYLAHAVKPGPPPHAAASPPTAPPHFRATTPPSLPISGPAARVASAPDATARHITIDEIVPVEVATTGVLTGRLTEPDTGEPIFGATVVAACPSLTSTRTAITDDRGAYELTDLLPGVYDVTFYYGDDQMMRSGVGVGSLDPTVLDTTFDIDP